MQYGKLEIEASKLAGLYDGMFYALIDGLVDFDIRPSRYANIVIKRIKRAWYNEAFFNV